MPHRPVPPDAPPGLRFRLLGGTSWLTDRRFYLAHDGSVWCREAGYAGFATPRWRAVPPEDWERIELSGQTLTQLVADLTQAPEDVPTARARR
jgi:hypothetical protein